MSDMKTIAVGVDFSPCSEVAIGQALGLARKVGAEVVLIHVGAVAEDPTGVPSSMQPTAARYRDVLMRRVADERIQLEALRAKLAGGGDRVRTSVADGFPDTALADAARAAGAELLVVGTHGRTGVRRVLLGSVAEKTLAAHDGSVLIARGDAGAADGGFKRILVGTDFSPLADRALERAVALAAPGATLDVVHAWHVPPDYSLDGSLGPALAELGTDLARDADAAGAALIELWRGRGVTLRYQTAEGPSADVLDASAAALRADLIAVGSHGRRGLRRFVLGSVAASTVRHAPCSVLVAR